MKKNVALIRRTPGAIVKRNEIAEALVTPVADIYETVDAFVVRLDMPGTSNEKIKLSIDSDRLSIRAAVGTLHKEGTGFLLGEIGQKAYHREFNLGDGIDLDRVDALYSDGVLTITLGKTDAMKSREIRVN